MKILTGIIFSNVAEAVVPDIVGAGAFYISPNAGPTPLAGKGCNKNYFVASWANDSINGSAGANAARLGYKRMFVLAPNYQAGKDAIEGFKRYYGNAGTIVGEIYTRLDQTDYSSELAQIQAAKPDAVFEFEPGGLGITFVKQYAQAGLKDTIPLVTSVTSLDSRIIAAVGDAALGVHLSTFWNTDFDNAANKHFVADFEKTYQPPTPYAAQGYDTARLIGSALKAVGGDIEIRRLPGGLAQGRFRLGTRRLQIRRQPAPDPELVLDDRGQGCQRQDRQQDRRQDPHRPGRSLRQGLPYVRSLGRHGYRAPWTKIAGGIIGISRNGLSASKSASPEIDTSARPSTASSRSLSSSASRQARILLSNGIGSAAMISRESRSRNSRSRKSAASLGLASVAWSSSSVAEDFRRTPWRSIHRIA